VRPAKLEKRRPLRRNSRTVKDVPPSPPVKLTVERRGQVVLGLNRSYIQNRIDPDTFENLAKALYDCEQDPTLRAAILFGHGPHFSRGIDVDASAARVREGKPSVPGNAATIHPLARSGPHLSKPLIVVTHGDTWNVAHELLLPSDIRIASEDTNFGQDENTHGRFPGGGATFASSERSGGEMRCATC
jgi:enoyl-CoA hydratase/carnithine racemase